MMWSRGGEGAEGVGATLHGGVGISGESRLGLHTDRVNVMLLGERCVKNQEEKRK